jgi:glycosyltransferase involved in cell wall biosynthesis
MMGGNTVEPAVSVVLPTFRREGLLSEAVASALVQRGILLEVIVADNSPEGSARSVLEAIPDPRMRYVHVPPCEGRVGRVRNAGARDARGPFVLFLDDDDLLPPGALRALADALDEHPDAGLAFGVIEPFGPNAARVAEEARYFEDAAARARRLRGRRGFTREMLFHPALVAASAVMMRLDALRAAGGFDETMRAWEDGECFLRVARLRGAVFVDRPVARRRIGHPAIVSTLFRQTDGRARVLEAYRYIHRRYRRTFGSTEFYALKVVDRLLPNGL